MNPLSFKIIVANWKANPVSLQAAQELFTMEMNAAIQNREIQTIICPPFVYLEELAKQLKEVSADVSNLSLGAQDVFGKESGPYTGEISTRILKDLGIVYVLVGHSDRRYQLGETEKMINQKIKALLAEELTPILLVGERQKDDSCQAVLTSQLLQDLRGLEAEQVAKILIAYEPVWAISTSPQAEADTPENTLAALAIIENVLIKNYQLETKNFLYGGSVTAQNVTAFLANSLIKGAVVGKASLRAEEFNQILKNVSQLKYHS